MGTRTKVVHVADLEDKAQEMIDRGIDDHVAVDTVLEGLDLFELLVVDGDEVSRLFRDGLLHRMNRINSPSRWWSSGGAKAVSVRVRSETSKPGKMTRVKVRFLNAQYSVSRGNLRVRTMTRDDLIEAGDKLIREGEGSIARGTFLKCDVVNAMDQAGVSTPEKLPAEILVRLEEVFGAKGDSNGSR